MLAMSGEKEGGSSEGTGLVVREREREKRPQPNSGAVDCRTRLKGRPQLCVVKAW